MFNHVWSWVRTWPHGRVWSQFLVGAWRFQYPRRGCIRRDPKTQLVLALQALLRKLSEGNLCTKTNHPKRSLSNHPAEHSQGETIDSKMLFRFRSIDIVSHFDDWCFRSITYNSCGSWKNMPIIANIASLPLASSALSFFFRSSGSAMPAFLGRLESF